MSKELDFTSPTWRAIEQHAHEQVAMLREKNDSPTLDATRTAELRGRIVVWKEVLALKPSAPANPSDVDGYSY